MANKDNGNTIKHCGHPVPKIRKFVGQKPRIVSCWRRTWEILEPPALLELIQVIPTEYDAWGQRFLPNGIEATTTPGGPKSFFKGPKKPRGFLGDFLYGITFTTTDVTMFRVQHQPEPELRYLPNTAKVQELLRPPVAPLGTVAVDYPEPWLAIDSVHGTSSQISARGGGAESYRGGNFY